MPLTHISSVTLTLNVHTTCDPQAPSNTKQSLALSPTYLPTYLSEVPVGMGEGDQFQKRNGRPEQEEEGVEGHLGLGPGHAGRDDDAVGR